MRTLFRLGVVIGVGMLVRAAWGRWVQGPHHSVPGVAITHPPAPPRAGS